ncbi:SDR family oxidoreductase [Pontimonas sp.]|nr:SDR family oxidoreductase [Pontimonas sp.]
MVVSGSTGAIGAAVVHDLQRDGYTVVGISRSRPLGGSSIATYSADVGSVESLNRARLEMAEDGLIVSHLVTCAASPGVSSRFLDSTEVDWSTFFEVDFFGIVNIARVFGQDILDHRGSMTNLTSFHTVATYPNRVAYVAAKSAVEGLSRGLAVEWGSDGARVNCVAPGPIESPRTAGFLSRDTGARSGMIGRTPLGRLGAPEDVASVVAFLVSDKSRHVTGQTIIVDGGWSSNAWWGNVSGGNSEDV